MEITCPPLPPVSENMDWEKYRREAHKVVDFIADYHKSLKERSIPVSSNVEPGFLRKLITSDKAPEKGEKTFEPVLDEVQHCIMPGITHWQHPDFYAWFPAQTSPGATFGDMIANAINQPGFNWMASPSATELEIIVMNWMSKAFGLPECMSWNGTGGGSIEPTATESAMVALLAAKNRVLERYETPEARDKAANKLVCYVSDQAHFCVEKASKVVAVTYLRKIATRRTEDGNCPMMGDDLARVIEDDIKAGLIPCFVSANYGTTGICATDDFDGIGKVCQKYNIWLNIDAAYAGATALCPEMRGPLLPAYEVADSIFINGSKWLNIMIGTSFFFFRERKYIVISLNATGVYLSNKYSDEKCVVDLKDYQLGMGKPFEALKVYTTLRYVGLEGMQNCLRRHCILTIYLQKLLQDKSNGMFVFPVKPKFALVCFRYANDKDNTLTCNLLHKFNTERRIMIVHHVLDDQLILRIVLAHPSLDEKDMHNLSDYIVEKAKEVKMVNEK